MTTQWHKLKTVAGMTYPLFLVGLTIGCINVTAVPEPVGKARKVLAECEAGV